MRASTLFLILATTSSTLAAHPRMKAHASLAKDNKFASEGSFLQDNPAMNGLRKIRRRKQSVCTPASESPSVGNLVASATTSNLTSTAVSSSATSSSTSSTAPASAPSSSAILNTSISGTGSKLFQLFPLGYGEADWTTCPDSNFALSFTGALKPLTAGSLPATSTAPDGTSAMIANYPAGTVQYSSATGHGYSFYTQGEHNGVIVSGAKEVLFSYSVYFPSGFQFNKGGKMPGLYGGTSLAQAKSCSGGRQTDRDSCFSARLMWRTNGVGESYNYYPTSVTQAGGYCSTPPLSICDTVYGDSIGRGSFTWSTGEWTTVAQRIKLNDVNKANGEQQLFVNGNSILHLTNLQLATSAETKIYGIMAQTFFGGNDASWASPVDQSAWFKDWSMTVLA